MSAEKIAESDAPATLAGYRTVGTHEPDCRVFETGWLCTMTCEASVIPPANGVGRAES